MILLIVQLSPALNLAVGLFVSCLPSGFEKNLPTSLHPTVVPAGRSGGKSLS
jgi:hypothetical protein